MKGALPEAPKRLPLQESNAVSGVAITNGHNNKYADLSDNEMENDFGGGRNNPQTDSSKFSMLQFAMFNFRDSLDKYDVLRDRENSIRGSIKMLESLKQNKQVKMGSTRMS